MTEPRYVVRLRELAERYAVPPAGVRALGAILALQAEDPTAPTAVRDPNVAVDRHVADSLVALDLEPVRAARAIADIGSGAGWPGLALAAALPDARVELVESAIRHCRYLERAVEVGGVGNVNVVNARAEAWPEGLGAHDLVIARALASLSVLCELRRAAARRGRVLGRLEGRGRRSGGGGRRRGGGGAGPGAGRGALGRALRGRA